jgi:hypothetical protein
MRTNEYPRDVTGEHWRLVGGMVHFLANQVLARSITCDGQR